MEAKGNFKCRSKCLASINIQECYIEALVGTFWIYRDRHICGNVNIKAFRVALFDLKVSTNSFCMYICSPRLRYAYGLLLQLLAIQSYRSVMISRSHLAMRWSCSPTEC
jgi:hypothetical protein